MNDDVRVSKQRKRLTSLFGELVRVYELIDQEMGTVSHTRGQAHRSLDPRLGDFVVHGENGITAIYTPEEGKSYQINIHT